MREYDADNEATQSESPSISINDKDKEEIPNKSISKAREI